MTTSSAPETPINLDRVRTAITNLATRSCPGTTPDSAFLRLGNRACERLIADTGAPTSATLGQVSDKVRAVGTELSVPDRSIAAFLRELERELGLLAA